jgi:hypothetical protein
MSNGHQFRQDMHKHTAQHQHQADAFSRHARDSARAATQGFQDRSQAGALEASNRARQQYEDSRRYAEASRRYAEEQTRRMGQPFEAWPGDNPGTQYEPAGSPGAAGRVLVGVIAVLMVLGWLAWMGWLGWVVISR